ncbi:MAG: hypothetical protein LJE95_08885 [Acidobacteria bacterium]|nr:hypothetical protein [Acidobacteriota bacterium]
MAFSAYGLHLGIRVSDASVMGRLPEVLPYGWEPSDDPEVELLYSMIVGDEGEAGPVRRLHVVYSDAMRLERTDDLELALGALEKDLHLFVGEMARGRVFVHAGVVGVCGRAIVMPGRSFSGKSSLVAALVRAGATYFSDEFAVLDHEGLVHPFARPLSLRCTDPYRGDPVTVEELGGTIGEGPLPVGAIVAATFAEGAAWKPQPLSPGETVLELLANTLSARRQPEVVLPVLQQVAESAPAVKGDRGEAEEAAVAILGFAATFTGGQKT